MGRIQMKRKTRWNFRIKKSFSMRLLILAGTGLIILLSVFLLSPFCLKGMAEGKEIIVVIDPGHGGENEGAIYNGVTEKEITLRVAYSMKRELENYEGVKVYMTRFDDVGMELDERAEFAREKNADILLSLHFNMAETHLNSGSEMWISSQGALKTKAMAFANVENELLKQLGIAKTLTNVRLNELNQDYYGVIRESSSRRIPACIVEHCYLDCPEEYQFYDSYEALETLGKLDATAVAMTYHLKSGTLGVDYTGLKKKDMVLPERVTAKDTSGPLYVGVTVSGYNKKKNNFILDLKITDQESSIVSYRYSMTGGNAYSDSIPIFTCDGNTRVEVPALMNAQLTIQACNAYGLTMESETIDLSSYYEQYVENPENNRENGEELDILKDDILEGSFFRPAGYHNDEWWVDAGSLAAHRFMMLFGGMIGVIAMSASMILYYIFFNKKEA